MEDQKYTDLQEKLSQYAATISNPGKIAIMQQIACRESCESEINEIAGLSRFTVGMNLKYLKKYGLIKGNLTSRNISYCIDYSKLEEFKSLFDQFYNMVMENKDKLNGDKISCNKGK
ncbi:MAG: ArsR family transcriptional regulator [Bacteroidetes bacterium]|jgi:predicted transcriptional regulator|nr:ArsR family transcriptional regulator [Bacteroidota bacterium]